MHGSTQVGGTSDSLGAKQLSRIEVLPRWSWTQDSHSRRTYKSSKSQQHLERAEQHCLSKDVKNYRFCHSGVVFPYFIKTLRLQALQTVLKCSPDVGLYRSILKSQRNIPLWIFPVLDWHSSSCPLKYFSLSREWPSLDFLSWASRRTSFATRAASNSPASISMRIIDNAACARVKRSFSSQNHVLEEKSNRENARLH